MSSKVHIIIPSHNGEATLPSCLDSVLAQDYTSFDITIVDNGSMDDTVTILKERYPDIRVVSYKQNMGFCYAVNQEVIKSQQEYIAILHDDAVVDPSWLRAMVHTISSDDKIFSVAPVGVYPHNPAKVKQAGLGYTLGGTCFGLHSGRKVKKLKQKIVFAAPDCGVLYRKDVFQNLNGFDENFFSIGQDLDIGWRAAKMGYKNVLCPEAKLCRSRELVSIDADTRARLEARNNVWTIYKNMPKRQRFVTFLVRKSAEKSRTRLHKKERANRSYKQGLIEGHKSKKRICKAFRPKRAFLKNVKIKWKMIKYSFVNFVRFPK